MADGTSPKYIFYLLTIFLDDSSKTKEFLHVVFFLKRRASGSRLKLVKNSMSITRSETRRIHKKSIQAFSTRKPVPEPLFK